MFRFACRWSEQDGSGGDFWWRRKHLAYASIGLAGLDFVLPGDFLADHTSERAQQVTEKFLWSVRVVHASWNVY